MLWPAGLGLALALAACGGSSGQPPAGVNRIAFIGPDGHLYTARADGSELASMSGSGLGELTSSGSRHVENWPTWSPDGRWIAFTRLTVSAGDVTAAAVVVIGSDGRGERPLALPRGTAPIYLSWSPNSRFLTVLLQQRDSLAFHLVDLSESSPAITPAIDAGAPLFSSWAPDSSALVLHVNGDSRLDPRARMSRVDALDPSGHEPLPMAPGSFNTPAWAPDGADWVFAAGIGDRQDALYLRQGGRSVLLAQGAYPAFVWAPHKRRLAYSMRPNQRADGYAGLWVTDGTGPGSKLADDPLAAFFWSPDGRHLALFSPSGEELTLLVLDADGSHKRPLATFAPTQQFAQLMSFFDQYAQSHTVWSPDSSSVLFAGVRASGNGTSNNPHVFVAAADGSGVRQIADGSIAFWSPRPS